MRIYLLIALLFIVFASFAFAYEPFEDYTKQVKVILEEGKTATYPVTVFNPNEETNFNFDAESEKGFFTLGKNSLLIGEKSYGSTNVFFGPEEEGAYFGSILVGDGTSQIKIPVLLVVKSAPRDRIFDVGLELSQNSLTVSPGMDFGGDVSLYNIKNVQETALVTYSVVNLQGIEILRESEYLDIHSRQIKIGKRFTLPSDASLGDAYFVVSVEQGSGDSKSYSAAIEQFSIDNSASLSPVTVEKDYSLLVALGIVMFLMISVLFLTHYWHKRVITQSKDLGSKIVQVKKSSYGKVERSLKKLEHEKALLEQAYKNGYIAQDTYIESRNKIMTGINTLKKRL